MRQKIGKVQNEAVTKPVGIMEGNVTAKARTQKHREKLKHGKISDQHIAVIPVASDAVNQRKLYKVDIDRKVLIETAARWY